MDKATKKLIAIVLLIFIFAALAGYFTGTRVLNPAIEAVRKK